MADDQMLSEDRILEQFRHKLRQRFAAGAAGVSEVGEASPAGAS